MKRPSAVALILLFLRLTINFPVSEADRGEGVH
jgi:hypothetical protein